MGLLGSVGKALGGAASSVTGAFTGKTSLDMLGGGDYMRLVPGIGDSLAAQDQNKANILAADRAMAFSERMSSTAYQRAMADMKKAGLNPTLAYMQGGASAPSGVTPTIASETKAGLGSTALNAALGFKAASTQAQQADTQQAQAESAVTLNKSTAAKQVQEVSESQARTRKANAEADRIRRFGPRDEAQMKLERRGTDLVEKLMNGIGDSAKQMSQAKKSISSRIWDQVSGKNAPVQSPQARLDAYKPNAKGYGK